MRAAPTLEQLEPQHGVEQSSEDSYLLGTLRRLLGKPVDEFSAEDLRICIGQQVGLRSLMPIALARLERRPLASGDFYPGDLLVAVVRARHWLALNPPLLSRVQAIARRARDALKGQSQAEHVLRELNALDRPA